ncbi:MAG: Vms1/Ankzf1 family peptidyl-tRNA hydrolase [Dehalococcoidia bacterium]
MRGLLPALNAEGARLSQTLLPGEFFLESPSETGWYIVETERRRVAVAPPYPIRAAAAGDDLAPLARELDEVRVSAVILVRLGRYAVGVFEGTLLVSSKVDARYVGGQHKAGGWSQKRFVRIREKQARELFDKVCLVAQEKLTPYEDRIERLWLGGDEHVLNGFRDRCPWVERFAGRIAERRLATPKPDLAGLKSSIEEALSFLVLELPRETTGAPP